MNHYSAFLRPYHGKSSNHSSTSNNETDENSSIKNLFLKHLSKAQQNSLNNNSKGSIRGILGEVGNVSLGTKSTTSALTKPKIIQQQQQLSVATIIETKTIISAPPPAPPPTSTLNIPSVVNKIEEITLNENKENDECSPFESTTNLTKVPPEFDCDSGDSYNITTASEYVVDICKYWRELEQSTSIRQNFFIKS